MIASCAAIDCIYGQRAEIGIKTMEGFRKQGYGIATVRALLTALFEQGFDEIGWHCVSSNRGSIHIAETVGFSLKTKYEAYSPFPPIENLSDLDAEEWMEYARFFEDKANRNANHYWQAAKCWAKAGEMSRSVSCIGKMIDNKLFWFKDFMDQSPEFARLSGSPEWISLMNKIR
jgi:hypothetical protein